MTDLASRAALDTSRFTRLASRAAIHAPRLAGSASRASLRASSLRASLHDRRFMSLGPCKVLHTPCFVRTAPQPRFARSNSSALLSLQRWTHLASHAALRAFRVICSPWRVSLRASRETHLASRTSLGAFAFRAALCASPFFVCSRRRASFLAQAHSWKIPYRS